MASIRRSKKQMTKQLRQQLKDAGFHVGKRTSARERATIAGILRPSRKKNSARLTKKQRSARAKRAGAIRRKVKAVAQFMKKINPGRKVNAVRLKRLKGGGVTIIPIKIKVKGRRSAA